MSGTKATLGGTRRDRAGRRLVIWITAVVVVGLLLAWDVWEAIGNLVGLRANAAYLGTELNPTGWVVLLLGLVLPVLCFVAALVLGRGRSLPVRIALLVAALCLSAALSLDLQLVLGFESLVSLA